MIGNTVGFGVAILLARELGPDGRGVLTLYSAAVALGFAFLNLGIGGGGFYFAARREITGRDAMEAGLSISLLAAAVTAIGVVVARVVYGSELAERHLPYALIIVAVPALVQIRAVDAVLRAQGRFGAVNAIDLGLPLSMVATVGMMALTVGLDVPKAVWAWTLSYLPPLLLGYFLIGAHDWPRRLASKSMLRQVVRFGAQGQLTNLILLANSRLDSFLILVFVNTAGVGLYTVASSQTEGLWTIANSVAIVLLTNITSGDADNAARMTPVVCRNTLLVTFAGAVGAAVIVSFWLPVVFGRAYSDSVLPYLWLLPGTVALSGSKILAAYVFSRGRPIINAWIALATLFATIPTDIVLISFFGVAGAAAGTSIGYALSLALTAAVYRRLSGNALVDTLLPQRSDAGLYLDLARSALRRLRLPRRPAVA